MEEHENERGTDWTVPSLFFHPVQSRIFSVNEESQDI